MPERSELELDKYEGLGNDFLVLAGPLAARLLIELQTAREPGGGGALEEGRLSEGGLGELARATCDRHRGFGADGLLVLGPGAPSGESLTFRLFNADGSEAEMSGNGLRCLAHCAIDLGVVPGKAGSELDVLTPAGRRKVSVRAWRGPQLWSATEMGSPRVLGGDSERCNIGRGQLRVDVGNPHLVVAGPDPATVDVAALGSQLSASAGAAAGGTNVEFVALGPGRDELTMRVWERGVGETQACGTGSVAAVIAMHYWGRVGTKVTVHQPGGDAEVELRPDETAVLAGPSQRIGRCLWEFQA
jgi:diaminopimelate epimerase